MGEIVPDDAEIDKDQEAEYKYLNYLLEQKNATWGQQFKNAVCLGPALDAEGDDMDDITGLECICFILLFVRRKFIGGELGGPTMSKNLSAALLVILWFTYIIMSILQNYDVIDA